MKRIIYTRPDGGVSVVIPTGEIPFEDVLKKDVPPNATNVSIVDASKIPSDRYFRNAWVCPNGKIEHDMTKCREIHKDRLRALRAPKLEDLDVEYQRADEREIACHDINDQDSVRQARTDKREITAQKQTLRDVTKDPRIVAATTPDELKAAIPACLS